MKREILNQYLEHHVIITFTDGDVLEGVLKFCDRFCAEHDYRKPNYYYIGNMNFKCSHVKKLRQIDKE